MSFHQFLLILRARWVIATVTLLLAVGASLVASLKMPPNYTASTEVLVDVKSPDPIGGMVLPAMVSPSYMATQVDIISSSRVSERVVDLLKLGESPEMKSLWQEETKGHGNYRHWVAERLSKRLDVKPSRESNVITISYRSPDPAFSAAAANAFAQAYIEANVALTVEPAKLYNGFFTARSEELLVRLQEAQRKLWAFQQSHGIVSSDERVDAESQRFAELQNQLVTAQAQGAESTSRNNTANDTMPEVMQSNLVQQLKADVARQQAKLDELGGNLGHNHPQYQRAEAELNALRQKLGEEIGKVRASVDTASMVSEGKTADIRAKLEDARRRTLDTKRARGEVMVLQQEVETAQRAYDSVSQRLTQANLTSHTDQTNVAVLSPAVEPSEASSPKILLNTLLGTFVGLVLGVAAALARELGDRRVRSRSDLDHLPQFHVLAELSAS